jgi:hypothetical protein
MYKNKVNALLVDFKINQLNFVRDWRNGDLKTKLYTIFDAILSAIKKSHQRSLLNYVIEEMECMLKNPKECDVSMVRNFLEKLYRLKNHRIAGSPNPFPIASGGAGNGVGRSGR